MTSTEDIYLVTGATGKTGRRVVEKLQRTGRRAKPASRSGIVKFDWAVEDTWSSAVEGATAVYLIAPLDPASAERFVEVALAAGVGKFVCLSARALDQFPPGTFEGMKGAETALQKSGAEWSIIRANNFNQNFSEDLWREPLQSGNLALPMDDTPEPFVDVADIADVAVEILTSDGHGGRIYDLSGPQGVTFADAVSVLATAVGREMRYEEISPRTYQEQLRADGVPEEVADELNVLFDLMRAGLYAEPGRGVKEVLGREPRRFEDFASQAASEGAWT